MQVTSDNSNINICLQLFRGEAMAQLPWIRVAVEKPTAGPGGAKEEGRRERED